MLASAIDHLAILEYVQVSVCPPSEVPQHNVISEVPLYTARAVVSVLNAAGASQVSVCARTHCLSLSHTHTHTHTPSLTHTHTHTHTHSLSLLYTHAHCLSLSHSQRRGCWSRVGVRAVRAARDSLTLRASVTGRVIFRLVFRCSQFLVK